MGKEEKVKDKGKDKDKKAKGEKDKGKDKGKEKDKGKDKGKEKENKKPKMTKQQKKEMKSKKKSKVATSVNYAVPSQSVLQHCGSSGRAAPGQQQPNVASPAAKPGGSTAPSAAPGSEWIGVGQQPGLTIWRIEKFKVIPWPRENYGSFFNGDSYIVLNSYKRGNALAHDIHFWLGDSTTQDEAGTAAYKTVELDDRLGGGPVQHREVQGFESDLFMSYFPPALRILDGGVETGFTIVQPTAHSPRLLQVKGARNVRVEQVDLDSSSLNSGDAFILDLGDKIFQWHGKASSPGERTKAGEITRAIKEERKGKAQIVVVQEGDNDAHMAEFWAPLGGPGEVASAAEGGDDFEHERNSGVKKLFKLSDASGTLTFTEVASGKLSRSLLDSNDVFVCDTGAEIYSWIGKGASKQERTYALQYAQDYLARYNRPTYLPISRILEGGENPVFNQAFN